MVTELGPGAQEMAALGAGKPQGSPASVAEFGSRPQGMIAEGTTRCLGSRRVGLRCKALPIGLDLLSQGGQSPLGCPSPSLKYNLRSVNPFLNYPPSDLLLRRRPTPRCTRVHPPLYLPPGQEDGGDEGEAEGQADQSRDGSGKTNLPGPITQHKGDQEKDGYYNGGRMP